MSTLQYPKVLVTGARGQLAQALVHAAPDCTECVVLGREELDITDYAAVRLAVEDIKPQLVINGAAYNLVDLAENEAAADALAINSLGVAQLSRVCRDFSTPLVHFSTDYVFDGTSRTPYTEDDATGPLSIYAASKLAGENIALATSERNWAIRVCRLFGPAPAEGAGSARKPAGNFPMLMLRLGKERGRVRVVCDQVGTPSYTPDLARGVWQLLEKSNGGLFHLTNAGEVSFDEYARAAFDIAGVECEVEPVSSEEYNAPARRPKYSTLSNDKVHSVGVEPLRHWKDALREFLQSA